VVGSAVAVAGGSVGGSVAVGSSAAVGSSTGASVAVAGTCGAHADKITLIAIRKLRTIDSLRISTLLTVIRNLANNRNIYYVDSVLTAPPFCGLPGQAKSI
jgi:hypothetical protein